MSQDSETYVVEGDKEDRISDLPGGIIDHILGLLPVQDAARTSILSKNWRYIWRKLPYLVLDNRFLGKKLQPGALSSRYVRGSDNWFLGRPREMFQSVFRQKVDSIILLHLGDFVKFVLYIIDQEMPSLYEEDVDRWMRHVTRYGIKDLILRFPREVRRIYKVPSCVFNCTTLRRLKLCCCVFKPPNSFLDFPKLETLHLEAIYIVPTTDFYFLNVPLLVNLALMNCDGTQYLHIVSPHLEMLFLYEVHYVVLNYFMNCKRLRELRLSFSNSYGNMNHDERSNVGKLLFSSAPALEKLHLSSSILELLNAGTIPRGPLCMLNCLRDISSIVDFGKFSHTSGLLQLITSVPNLSKLEIRVDKVDSTSKSANAVKEYKRYLSSLACSDQTINKLKHVVIRWFRGTDIELLFLKLLLARTPSLVKMSIDVRFEEERSIPGELISCPKASPNAEVYFIQDGVSQLNVL